MWTDLLILKMYRLVVFSNGGFVDFDKNPSVVPTGAINELVVKECISSGNTATQKYKQLVLGRNNEYTASLHRDAEQGTNTAILYPAALRMADAAGIVKDVSKIYASSHDEPEKLRQLVDLRLKQLKIDVVEEKEVKHEEEVDEKEKKKEVSKKSKKGKKKRTWDGYSDSEDSDKPLDFSESKPRKNKIEAEKIDATDLGTESKNGFVVKELTDELGDILSSSSTNLDEGEQFGFLKKFIGGKKLDETALKSVLAAMEDHLVAKNVAKEVADDICKQVQQDLMGKSTSNWTSVKSTVRESVKHTLQKILTPATSTNLLASIKHKNREEQKPYVISVVGVNGVGKSTNLGKLAFWFLQNDMKILVAACDTFRSGAVEQLKVHVTRLAKSKGTKGEIELFDQGYGKDAALIAKRAVEYAEKNHFDVVLIDTAGRRHNDDRLMSNLEKFGNQANPDKIIMVGEALVGTDSVEQARNFDAAFGKNRGLDFFLISKCDTVGEMLGALVNVTYATGVPVLFVGVGQQYTDLRTLSVDWAVDKLLS